jgi:hypothetical protein
MVDAMPAIFQSGAYFPIRNETSAIETASSSKIKQDIDIYQDYNAKYSQII